jgi:glycosidase
MRAARACPATPTERVQERGPGSEFLDIGFRPPDDVRRRNVMPTSVWSSAVESAFTLASSPRLASVQVGPSTVVIEKPFPSPQDWRDQWIYFLLIDRFNNPERGPRHAPFDGAHGVYQGGTFSGIREQLDYLRALGAGALWLSPVIKNCQFEDTTYHGYGFQDFLRVEPRFASDPVAARADPQLADVELQRLVDEAHARGLYVIFDVVLNHAGNVFAYEGHGDSAPFREQPYGIGWRDEHGAPAFDDFSRAPADLSDDAAVWPRELQRNIFWRRQGKGGEAAGDFESLKEVVTGYTEDDAFGRSFLVRTTLIRAYQHLIAKFDVDGFRIDTLKFVEPEFARTFGNAMREFALSIGKKNFFTFGEVFDDEEKIAGFIGRNATDADQPIGVDAALDFPLFFKLPGVAKGFTAPLDLARLYEHRKEVQRGLITTHGEASGHFVTFLDNHDMRERFYFSDPGDAHRFDDQMTLALACLFALQGIPCLYYGTEQGLHGRGGSDLAVREALWGKPEAFDRDHRFYEATRRLATLRAGQPALRYGRLYFRGLSGDGVHFGVSPFRPGVLAFSRILNDLEVLVVANASPQGGFRGEVVVDASLNPDGAPYQVLFSNKAEPQPPDAVTTRPRDSVEIREPDGRVTPGPVRVLRVHLQPMEAQILRKAR